MQTAMIGLGKMGINMARRLVQGGHEVIAYNRTNEKTEQLVNEGAEGAYSIKEMVQKLSPPRVVWIMLPAGEVVDKHIIQLEDILDPKDIIIDGGNTHYKDDILRSESLGKKGIRYVDVGVSGGIWGLKKGYCLMVGGEKEVFHHLESLFKTLAPKDGYLYCGAVGSGHFLKMVHNGIEYGIMQAYAEGFQILKASPYAEFFSYEKISHLWNQGSVIRSWLLELAETVFSKSPDLKDIKGYIEESGEGRWAVQQAVEEGVSAPVITLALMRRFQSQEEESFADRLVSALRREFGGHTVFSSD